MDAHHAVVDERSRGVAQQDGQHHALGIAGVDEAHRDAEHADENAVDPFAGLGLCGGHGIGGHEDGAEGEAADNLGDAAAVLTENSAFWTDGREHTNTTGFSARPGSYCYASYDTLGNGAFGNAFYFATADFDSESMVAEMSYAATCINGQLDFTSMAVNNYMPVRCIKGDGVTTFAPTLDIEYRGITTSEATLMGNYSDNNHYIEDFELYMSTDPAQMSLITWESPYMMMGQWSYFELQNLTPDTTYYVQMCMVYDGGQRLCVGGVFHTEQ